MFLDLSLQRPATTVPKKLTDEVIDLIWIVEEWPEGNQVLISKFDNEIKIFSVLKNDITNDYPQVVDYIKKYPKDIVLEAYLVSDRLAVLKTHKIYEEIQVVASDLLFLFPTSWYSCAAYTKRRRLLIECVKELQDLNSGTHPEDFMRMIEQDPSFAEKGRYTLKNGNANYDCGSAKNYYRYDTTKIYDVVFIDKTVDLKGDFKSLRAVLSENYANYIHDQHKFLVSTKQMPLDKRKELEDNINSWPFPLKGKIKCLGLYDNGTPIMARFVSFEE